MAQESFENIEAQTSSAVRAARDVADRAGSFVQHQMAQLADGGQDLAREANARVRDYTGRGLDDWAADLRGFVRTHPLQALIATVGIGYILGKILRR